MNRVAIHPIQLAASHSIPLAASYKIQLVTRRPIQLVNRRLTMIAILFLSTLSMSWASSSIARAHSFETWFHSSIGLADTVSIEGRWDITVHQPGREMPSWLEIVDSGISTLVGRFVGGGGSARPISKISYSNGKMSFSIPPQWEREDRDLSVEGSLQGDSLTGMMTTPNGKQYSWVGRRAPSLRRNSAPLWGPPVSLFNGRDLKGWHALGDNQWVAGSGILRSPHSGANIVTDANFTDFKLHIEFRLPKGSNSGVYLRGRYELQIEDGEGMEPENNQLGAVYGFLPPSDMMTKGPGEWQSYDVTLVGRRVTVVLNDKTVICDQEIPGITGGALDSKEGEPGPIYLQGDHGPVEFRHIEITPAR